MIRAPTPLRTSRRDRRPSLSFRLKLALQRAQARPKLKKDLALLTTPAGFGSNSLVAFLSTFKWIGQPN